MCRNHYRKTLFRKKVLTGSPGRHGGGPADRPSGGSPASPASCQAPGARTLGPGPARPGWLGLGRPGEAWRGLGRPGQAWKFLWFPGRAGPASPPPPWPEFFQNIGFFGYFGFFGSQEGSGPGFLKNIVFWFPRRLCKKAGFPAGRL